MIIVVTQRKYILKPSNVETICFDFVGKDGFMFRIIQNIEDARYKAAKLKDSGHTIEFIKLDEYAKYRINLK